MPELPEVETIRRDLQEDIIGQRVTKIDVRLAKSVRNPEDLFVRTLLNRTVKAIDRRGKLLMVEFDGTDWTLLIHLRMTGQLLFQRPKQELVAGGHPWPPFDTPLPNKYTHVILEFSKGGILFFNDLRQFGYMKLVDPAERAAVLKQYGVEPITDDFTLDAFTDLLGKRKGPVKGFLLNQTLVSGLGNIYADEACWHAQIRPDRKINSLSRAEVRALFQACRDVLTEAIEHRGTSFRDYRDSQGRQGGYAKLLKVYGRAGEACPRCGGTIIKTRLVGRGTHSCPACQR